MSRRTVTIDELPHKLIQRLRAVLLEMDYEVSYTTIVNWILTLGLLSLTDKSRDERIKLASTYMKLREPTLELEAPLDELHGKLTELALVALPKLEKKAKGGKK